MTIAYAHALVKLSNEARCHARPIQNMYFACASTCSKSADIYAHICRYSMYAPLR